MKKKLELEILELESKIAPASEGGKGCTEDPLCPSYGSEGVGGEIGAEC